MSWGWKIVILIAAFVIFVLFMVFMAVQEDFHLVADNYYEKEIKYQGEIDRIRNARALTRQLKIEYLPAASLVIFTYPEDQKKEIRGEITFFRPSDASLDQRYLIEPDDQGQQRISVQSLPKGLWQVKVNWEYGSSEYREEKNLIFQ